MIIKQQKQTNIFYISFVNIASGKIYKNIDWLQNIEIFADYKQINTNEKQQRQQQGTETRKTERKRKRKKQKPQGPDIEKYIFLYFP